MLHDADNNLSNEYGKNKENNETEKNKLKEE